MKRLNRDPVKFDVFAAFADYAAKHGLSIRDANALVKFGQAVTDATSESLDNDIFVFGNRVQVMFATIVAALGKVRGIKQEDAGDGFFADDIKIPDYRLVIDGTSQLLVEVKNFKQKKPSGPFELDVAYLRKLEAYARLMNTPLSIAVYWYRWNLWTLTPADAFVIAGDTATLHMGDAFKATQMSRLGDVMVGTRAPLRYRIEMSELGRDGDLRRVVIREAKLLSEDRPVTTDVERRIAMMLMLHGDWDEEQVVEQDHDKLIAVEYRFAPPKDATQQDKQGFEMNTWISSMVSRWFRDATVKDGQVTALHTDFTPGEFGRLIPEDYDATRDALPLWRFELQPS